MGFLDRAIRRGIGDAVENAVGNAVKKVVEPKATELANRTAEQLDQAAETQYQGDVQRPSDSTSTGGFEGAMANLQRSAENYATQAAMNMKICPACEYSTTADKTFCPSCGTRLPDQTLAQGTLCTHCGLQNTIGTKFCSGCGEKLPATLAEEQAAAERSAAVLADWGIRLPHHPKWDCGGTNYELDEYEPNGFRFSVDFSGDASAAKRAVESYRQAVLQNGFREAGEYPSRDHLYKKVDGICYHVDFEHAFDGDSDCPSLALETREPPGGFDYVKPEPRKKNILDLFK